jgi:integrase
MSRKRDMTNIRERIVVRNGKEETHYQVRTQRMTSDGRLVRVSRTLDNLDAARKYRDGRRSQLGLEEFGDKLAQREEWRSISLRDVWCRYRDHLFFKDKKSIKNEKIAILAFMERAPWLWDKSVTEISIEGTKYFRQYRDSRLMGKDRVSLATLKRELNPIRHMFKIARTEWGYPVGDPFRDLYNNFSEKPREARILKPEEDTKLYKAIEETFRSDHLKLRWLSLILTALATALRRGVLLKLRWSDLNWGNKLLSIPRSYCDKKKNAPPIVPVSRFLYAHLNVYYNALSETESAPTARMFPIKERYLETIWTRIAERAELYTLEDDGTKNYTHFQDLRHTASTRYNRPIGLFPDENEYMLGHKNRSTNAHYRKHIDPMEWVESIRTKLDAIEFAHDGRLIRPVAIASVRAFLGSRLKEGQTIVHEGWPAPGSVDTRLS